MRNEAHRFGIEHHRNRRSKSALVSEITQIKGIGEKTQEELMKHFKTISKIKAASERSEEHTSELQSRPHLVCRLLLEKKKKKRKIKSTNSHKQEIIKTRNQLGTRQNEKIAIINQY